MKYASARPTGSCLFPDFFLLAISVVLALQKPVWGIPLFGYTATMTIMFGMALITPFLAAPLSGLIHRTITRFLGAEGFLAQKNLLRNLGRSSVILCAIMVSLGMTVSFIFMIHSFRTSLADLIDQVVRFQFFVADRHRLERGAPVLLPKRFVRRDRSHRGRQCGGGIQPDSTSPSGIAALCS